LDFLHRARTCSRVLVSGISPIRAQKARYFEDRRFAERILPAPKNSPIPDGEGPKDDWTGLTPKAPAADLLVEVAKAEADAANGGIRREPELPGHEAVVKEGQDASKQCEEFVLVEDRPDETARRAEVMRQRMRGIARQGSMDPADHLGL
jgi:type IV secretion system protein VirD4